MKDEYRLHYCAHCNHAEILPMSRGKLTCPKCESGLTTWVQPSERAAIVGLEAVDVDGQALGKRRADETPKEKGVWAQAMAMPDIPVGNPSAYFLLLHVDDYGGDWLFHGVWPSLESLDSTTLLRSAEGYKVIKGQIVRERYPEEPEDYRQGPDFDDFDG